MTEINILKKHIPEKWLMLALQYITVLDMIKIGTLVNSKRENEFVYPPKEDIFKSMSFFSPEETKIVILGQDPYINKGEANGLAFSTGNDTIPPSLRNIFKEIETDVYNGLYLDQNPDLSRWAKQGVLLLNTVLTVDAGKSKSHSKIGWETFTRSIIKGINDNNENVIFLLWGGDAKKYQKYISNNNISLVSGHPSPLSANRGYWFGNRHFSQTNIILEKLNKKKIKW